ncbi:DUF982 domain-containing protein [Microvirga antarctica]|uniref:DUF982 domain-containing protein n=1 Tax=Microvirga antarctica TaxID=2819233 RepID=UPI003CCEEC1E
MSRKRERSSSLVVDRSCGPPLHCTFSCSQDWLCHPLPDSRLTFENAITLVTSRGVAREVRCIACAADILLREWPQAHKHTAVYQFAVRACRDPSTGEISSDVARIAFLAAALDAGILRTELLV